MKTLKILPLTALIALMLSLDALAMGSQPPAENTPAPTPPARQETPVYPVSTFTAGNSLDLRTARDPRQFLGTWVRVMETCGLSDPTSTGYYQESGLQYGKRLGLGLPVITIRHVPIDLLPGGAQSQYFSRVDLTEVSFLNGGKAQGELESPIQIFENWVKITGTEIHDLHVYGQVRSQRACKEAADCPDKGEWLQDRVYRLGSYYLNPNIRSLVQSGEMQVVRAELGQNTRGIFCGISASDSTLLICHDQAEPWGTNWITREKIRQGCASAYRKAN